MYEEHHVFRQPKNEAIKVWRYMDFTKFVSLVETNSLYFTRSDKFEDPFEGSSPSVNITRREQVPDYVPKKAKEDMPEFSKKLASINRDDRKYHLINCWHMNEEESAAMWKLYLKSNVGIAVQSTYKNLKECFQVSGKNVYLGVVNYLDYKHEGIPESGIPNSFQYYVHKRKSFEHEREVRALIKIHPDGGTVDINNTEYPTEGSVEHGQSVKIDIGKLIERIYVAPSSPNWFVDLVVSVIKKYEFNFKVMHSKLDEEPMY